MVSGNTVRGIEYRGVLFTRNDIRRYQSTSALATSGAIHGLVVSTSMGTQYIESEFTLSITVVVSFLQRNGGSGRSNVFVVLYSRTRKWKQELILLSNIGKLGASYEVSLIS